MLCNVYPFGTLKTYKYADTVSVHKGQWIFCQKKGRTTWEHPAGHIDPGETPEQAARRELYEESGAIDFDLTPLCDYRVEGEFNGRDITGNGQVFYADVRTMGNLPPHSEMAQVAFFDTLPDHLTYPAPTDAIFPLVARKRNQSVE